MCGGPEKCNLPDAPDVRLANLIHEDFGVRLDHRALRLFVLLRWNEITSAAHAIHDKGKNELSRTR